MLWSSLQILFETFLILRRIQRDIVINVETSSRKAPLLLSDFNETWIFSTYLKKKARISSFIKIRPVGAEFLYAEGRTEGQTDMTKLIVAFRNTATAPKHLTVVSVMKHVSEELGKT